MVSPESLPYRKLAKISASNLFSKKSNRSLKKKLLRNASRRPTRIMLSLRFKRPERRRMLFVAREKRKSRLESK